MNPTLDQELIDKAMEEDFAAAKSEYLGEWRDDVGLFIPREVVESLVAPGRTELLFDERLRYHAFADTSGGRGDDAALAIAYRENKRVIVALLRRWKAPFDPQVVIADMVRCLQRFKLRRVTGDNYAAEFVAQAFKSRGVQYQPAEKNKSELYLELLPKLCSDAIELPDDETLINQLASLERRTRSGGRDIIDHPPGGHDDLANAIAGVAEVASVNRLRVGALQ